MNKAEIMEVLSEKSFSNNCVYCGEEVKKGFYNEDNLGRAFIFPKYLVGCFNANKKELPIHYRCMEAFILDLMREGDSNLNGTDANTRVIVRY